MRKKHFIKKIFSSSLLNSLSKCLSPLSPLSISLSAFFPFGLSLFLSLSYLVVISSSLSLYHPLFVLSRPQSLFYFSSYISTFSLARLRYPLMFSFVDSSNRSTFLQSSYTVRNLNFRSKRIANRTLGFL